MLVLSRQRDQSIMIGDNIEITVVDVRGDKVRLGINAPNTVPVHRKEVYQAIQREKLEGQVPSQAQTITESLASPAHTASKLQDPAQPLTMSPPPAASPTPERPDAGH
ncbi:MAG: carbon storage regulator CsrA [Phycisphaerae bacterium]|nr:carbon storage regulator CsrA [Phycisphaerae bacterium]